MRREVNILPAFNQVTYDAYGGTRVLVKDLENAICDYTVVNNAEGYLFKLS